MASKITEMTKKYKEKINDINEKLRNEKDESKIKELKRKKERVVNNWESLLRTGLIAPKKKPAPIVSKEAEAAVPRLLAALKPAPRTKKPEDMTEEELSAEIDKIEEEIKKLETPPPPKEKRKGAVGRRPVSIREVTVRPTKAIGRPVKKGLSNKDYEKEREQRRRRAVARDFEELPDSPPPSPPPPTPWFRAKGEEPEGPLPRIAKIPETIGGRHTKNDNKIIIERQFGAPLQPPIVDNIPIINTTNPIQIRTEPFVEVDQTPIPIGRPAPTPKIRATPRIAKVAPTPKAVPTPKAAPIPKAVPTPIGEVTTTARSRGRGRPTRNIVKKEASLFTRQPRQPRGTGRKGQTVPSVTKEEVVRLEKAINKLVEGPVKPKKLVRKKKKTDEKLEGDEKKKKKTQKKEEKIKVSISSRKRKGAA